MSANTEHIAVVGSFQSAFDDTKGGHQAQHTAYTSLFVLESSFIRFSVCFFFIQMQIPVRLAVDIRLALTQSTQRSKAHDMRISLCQVCACVWMKLSHFWQAKHLKSISYNRYCGLSCILYQCRGITTIAKFGNHARWVRGSNMTVTDVLSPRSKSIRLMHTIPLFYCLHYCHIDKFITLLFCQTNCKMQFWMGVGVVSRTSAHGLKSP